MANVNTSNLITAGKPIRCKAAIGREAGQPLVIEEVIVAPPKAHEVRIKIICTSLCYSDITFWKLKDPPGCFPRIFGHEAVGIVESVGEEVNEVVEGDYVVPVFIADCGECKDCKSSESNLCSKLPFQVSPWMPREKSSRFTDLKGETLFHFLFVSSFSEYTVVDIAHLTKLDPSVPPNRACLLSCGVSTGIGAAWRAAGVKPGSSVAIFGMGAIGLAVAEGSRLCGATKIIAVDINPEKFEIGKKFGVTDFVNPKSCEDKTVSQIICEMTDGGADYCFECVGMANLVQEAYASCRKGWGKTIVLGVDKPDSQLSLSSIEVLCSGKTLTGTLFGGLKAKSDVPILAKRYLDKERFLMLIYHIELLVSKNPMEQCLGLLFHWILFNRLMLLILLMHLEQRVTQLGWVSRLLDCTNLWNGLICSKVSSMQKVLPCLSLLLLLKTGK